MIASNPETSSDDSKIGRVPRDAVHAVLTDSSMTRFIHITALNAFFVAQPLLGKFSGNLQYLRHEHFLAASVLTAFGIIFLGLPIVIQAAMSLILRIAGRSAMERVFEVVLFSYGLLGCLLFSRWLSAEITLLTLGVSDVVLLVVAIPVAVVLSKLYFRYSTVRQCLTLSSAGVLLFPLSFFSSESAREIVFGIRSRSEATVANATNPVPVVMIVFDGMSGMSLLNQDHQVDSIRYPNFARLARTSTWFRNASTVHLRTDHALPAMLSSGLPEESFLPIESHYPKNLFRLIYDSDQYEMTVFEPFSQMSPEELCHYEYDRTFGSEVFELMNVSWRLYVNITFPRELLNPEIPRAWFGLSSKGDERQKFMRGQVVYSWDQYRTTQTDHFIESIRPTSKPGFYFLHLAVPHYPWSILPDGRSYLDNYSMTISTPGLIDEEWCGDEWPVQLCWQRNLLQIQYADRVLGRILDRLEQLELFDKSMVVVTSDHGLSFHAGKSLRALSDETLPDLLCVPLFVKLPQQHEGHMTDASVESIDILPTIAEQLGLPSDPRWEGSSVFTSAPRLRKTIAGPIPAIVNADFPERFRHVTDLIRVFGQSGPDDQIGRINLVPELTGLSVTEMEAEESAFECTVSRGQTPPYPIDRTIFPCFLTGRIRSSESLERPVIVAVAVNGRIAVTTRTSPQDDGGRRWTALIPPDLVNESAIVELFEVRSIAGGHTLHQIREVPLDP